MRLSIKNQVGFKLKTQENQSIPDKVVDFIIDQKNWKVKYLKIQKSGILKREEYYLPISFIHKVDFRDKRMKLFLEKGEVQKYSEDEDVLTVSQETDVKLRRILKKNRYWQRRYYPPISVPSITHNFDEAPVPVGSEPPNLKESEIESDLRSLSELKGYDVKFSSGKTAVVKDFILDSINWRIKEMVVGKRFSLFWNAKYLLNVKLTDQISCIQNQIYVDSSVEPEKDLDYYESTKPINKSIYGIHFDYRGVIQEK